MLIELGTLAVNEPFQRTSYSFFEVRAGSNYALYAEVIAGDYGAIYSDFFGYLLGQSEQLVQFTLPLGKVAEGILGGIQVFYLRIPDFVDSRVPVQLQLTRQYRVSSQDNLAATDVRLFVDTNDRY